MNKIEKEGVDGRILYLAFTRCMSARAISRRIEYEIGTRVSHSTVSRFLKNNRDKMEQYQSPPYYVKPMPGEKVRRYS